MPRFHETVVRYSRRSYGPSMCALSKRFSSIILDALIFKRKLSTTRETVDLPWYFGGDQIDSNIMEGHEDGHERVLLAQFPGLCLGEGGLHPELVVKARVLSIAG